MLNLFNHQQDNRLLYHNYQRSSEIAQTLNAIADAEQSDEVRREMALLACWFHQTGYLSSYNQPGAVSQQKAQAFLESRHYPAERLQGVLNCLQMLEPSQSPETPEAQLLSDARTAVNSTSRFFQQYPLLRLEQELVLSQRLSTLEWNQLQLQHLLNARFYTPSAKSRYADLVSQNILVQKEKTEKSRMNQLHQKVGENGMIRKFQQLERKLPSSAIQTFFRANYRNHINLSAIADNKANIMISVNAILISVVISVLSYRNISETNPMILLPVVIFLITGLTSLIFAVLSIRPKVTTLNDEESSMEQIKQNVVYFGNFVRLDLEQYEEAMDAVFRDGELLYGNMTRDLYFLGKVLDKKYRFLTLSYNIFMVGFVVTVVMFLVAMFS